jgi:hypothetical protein
MRGLLLVTVVLFAVPAKAGDAGTPQVTTAGTAQKAPVKPVRKATPRVRVVAPTTSSAVAAAPAAKRAPAKVSLDAAAVTGERQKPRAAYVLPPNVKAVQDAARSITNDHVESARER